jgi:hypothetical protein
MRGSCRKLKPLMDLVMGWRKVKEGTPVEAVVRENYRRWESIWATSRVDLFVS